VTNGCPEVLSRLVKRFAMTEQVFGGVQCIVAQRTGHVVGVECSAVKIVRLQCDVTSPHLNRHGALCRLEAFITPKDVVDEVGVVSGMEVLMAMGAAA